MADLILKAPDGWQIDRTATPAVRDALGFWYVGVRARKSNQPIGQFVWRYEPSGAFRDTVWQGSGVENGQPLIQLQGDGSLWVAACDEDQRAVAVSRVPQFAAWAMGSGAAPGGGAAASGHDQAARDAAGAALQRANEAANQANDARNTARGARETAERAERRADALAGQMEGRINTLASQVAAAAGSFSPAQEGRIHDIAAAQARNVLRGWLDASKAYADGARELFDVLYQRIIRANLHHQVQQAPDAPEMKPAAMPPSQPIP